MKLIMSAYIRYKNAIMAGLFSWLLTAILISSVAIFFVLSGRQFSPLLFIDSSNVDLRIDAAIWVSFIMGLPGSVILHEYVALLETSSRLGLFLDYTFPYSTVVMSLLLGALQWACAAVVIAWSIEKIKRSLRQS